LTSGPYNGVYAANKAFQIVLGETLWYELKGSTCWL
jgi:short-subunit dehydrogenase